MRIQRIFLIVLFCFIFLVPCSLAATVQPDGILSQDEVMKLFYDKTVESVTLKKGRVSVSYYSPTGDIRQLRDGQKRAGHWRVNAGGRICMQMEEAGEKCRVIVREKDGSYHKYIVKKNGQHEAVVGYRKFVNGNPNNL